MNNVTRKTSWLAFYGSLICTLGALVAVVMLIASLAQTTLSLENFSASHNYRANLMTIVVITILIQLLFLIRSGVTKERKVQWTILLLVLQVVAMPFLTYRVFYKRLREEVPKRRNSE